MPRQETSSSAAQRVGAGSPVWGAVPAEPPGPPERILKELDTSWVLPLLETVTVMV